MRFLPLFLAAVAVWAAADPAITQVKAVYLMPMGNGLDQYLATELIRERVFDVVTDPALADAVLTDRIGPAFEQALAELYPPAEPPPAPPPEPAAQKAAASPEKTAEKTPEKTLGEALADRPDVGRRISSFARSRGNVYLVDRRTKRVLWSEFRRPRNSRPEEVNRASDQIVDQLQQDLGKLRSASQR
jgi:hypothetical protein